ncbi:hypothetical protein [Ligilactobacillus apodemi]|uniref:Uncharacterized protein n=1 Tax=Ligilactobacillus apodemi DSM 16634 = JCM 16172 TaxID=1423724 RepID=A0A0R1TZK4_9LACO|nr:hypothetical protein [Ligilactobacillus apodemi]KRL84034.1 hypothetical protein FC32_GL001310 [Ligilactobacillus apodemi DSM 16634 = JCM 16172]
MMQNIKQQLRASLTAIQDETTSYQLINQDIEFIRFILKKVVFFKFLYSKRFECTHCSILSTEFLYLLKYFCAGDYRAFLLSERTIIETSLKIIVHCNERITTTELIKRADFSGDDKSRVTDIFKKDSQIIHHSISIDETDNINMLVTDMLKKSNKLIDPKERQKVIRQNMDVVKILMKRMIYLYEEDMSLIFLRQLDILTFLTNYEIK